MLEIETKLGLIIAPNGDKRYFGKQSYEITKERKDENYHDSAFVSEILNTEWFQNISEQLGFNYDREKSFFEQVTLMASRGCVFALNLSSRIPGTDNEYNAYWTLTSTIPTDEQKSYFTSSYEDWQELLTRKSAYFQATPITNEGRVYLNKEIYDLDEFYDTMNISKSNGKRR